MTEAATPEIVRQPDAHVVALTRDYTMQTRNQIPQQWHAWYEAGYDIANTEPGAMYGVSFDADGSGFFRYGVGVAVAAVPEDLPAGTCIIALSGGDYAVLRDFGPVTDLPARFDWMFASWLPESAFDLREGAVFERYPDDARNGPDGMAFEIWVPVVAKE